MKAVDGVDLTLPEGEILGLIGPNGAGKTTLVNALTGFQRPTSGRIVLAGVDVTGWPPNQLTRSGLVRTFQGARLFSGLTVLENVELGAVGVRMSGRESRFYTWKLLDLMNLTPMALLPAAGIPHGDARRLGIARALATNPRFVLLDEPAAGLNEGESAELVSTLRRIRDDFGCGLMVIEHDMGVVMNLCERVQVVDHGTTLFIGTPEQVRHEPAVQKAYLGTERKLEIVEEALGAEN